MSTIYRSSGGSGRGEGPLKRIEKGGELKWYKGLAYFLRGQEICSREVTWRGLRKPGPYQEL